MITGVSGLRGTGCPVRSDHRSSAQAYSSAVARRERRSSVGSAEVGAARWRRSMSAESRSWWAEWYAVPAAATRGC